MQTTFTATQVAHIEGVKPGLDKTRESLDRVFISWTKEAWRFVTTDSYRIVSVSIANLDPHREPGSIRVKGFLFIDVLAQARKQKQASFTFGIAGEGDDRSLVITGGISTTGFPEQDGLSEKGIETFLKDKTAWERTADQHEAHPKSNQVIDEVNWKARYAEEGIILPQFNGMYLADITKTLGPTVGYQKDMHAVKLAHNDLLSNNLVPWWFCSGSKDNQIRVEYLLMPISADWNKNPLKRVG